MSGPASFRTSCDGCGSPITDETVWGFSDMSISQLPEMQDTQEFCSATCAVTGLRRLATEIEESVAGRASFEDANGLGVWLAERPGA